MTVNLRQCDRTVGTDSGIDHCNVNRSERKMMIDINKCHGTREDLLVRNCVRDIYKFDIAMDRKNHALHLCHVRAAWTEVGGQRDDRTGHAAIRCITFFRRVGYRSI